MGLKQQIANLKNWACDKVNDDCHFCEFCIETDHWDDYADDWESYCTFDFVFNAAVDRAKEVQDNDT